MTLGEKIRHARKSAGMSQEQLAEKLCVSRSAIAKWETGKGMPDVENLKILSRLLCVSVDSLLDDGGEEATRQTYNLAAYGRGCKKVRKDRLMRERFPEAKICTLLGRPELTKTEKIVDNALGFLTPAPFGVPEFIKSVKHLDREYYLVEREESHLFVTVTDTYFEVRPLRQKQTGKSFRMGDWTFILCNYLTEE